MGVSHYLCFSIQHFPHLYFVFGVGLTPSVIGPDSITLWMVKPLAIRVTHFDYFFYLKERKKNLVKAFDQGTEYFQHMIHSMGLTV